MAHLARRELLRYGPGPDRVVEHFVPAGPRPAGGWPAIVLLHGGYWRQRYDRHLMDPLAESLAAAGLVALNLEYRRVGGSGGWPWTGADVLAAIDVLTGPGRHATLDTHELDPDRVALVGHSAGGHLALWAAGQLPVRGRDASSGPRLRAVVALAPVADLHAAERAGLSGDAARRLLRAPSTAEPGRWRAADPMSVVGHGHPTLLVHGTADTDVPISQSRAYVEAARRAGTPVELRIDDADHFACIDPASDTWAGVQGWLTRQLADR